MKQLSIIVFLFFLLLITGSIAFSQPKIAKDEIPAYVPEDVKVLIQKLYSPNAVERAKAAVELGGEKLAIPSLVTMLGDGTKLVWSAYGPRAGGTSTSPGFEAAKSLRKMGDAPVPNLIEAMKDKDAVARQNAAIALLWIGEDYGPKSIAPATDILVMALKDESSEIRWRAAWALRVLEWRPTDQKLLIDFLILTQNFEELSDIGQPAVAALIVALEDKGWDTRCDASKTLGMIGDISAVEPLIKALKDENSDVKESAAAALTKLTGEDYSPDDEK